MADEIEWMRLTAEELRARAEADALVIVPVGSLEQHGPHLATGVDIVLATAVAEAVARRLADAGAPVVITPTVWTGLAEHHMAFGGTVTLDYDAFAGVLRGILRSAQRCGFRRAMLLNGHGGNAEAVAVAATAVDDGARHQGRRRHLLAPDRRRLRAHPGAPSRRDARLRGGDQHDARAQRPTASAASGSPRRTARVRRAWRASRPRLALRRSFRDVSPSGVIGDARPATAAKGGHLLDTAAERIAGMLSNPALWR